MSINRVFDIFLLRFNEFALKSYFKLLNTTDFKFEEQLNHYTSLGNLQNIVNNSTFQASSIYMINDPNELVLGYSQITEWFFEKINKTIK